MATYGIQVKQRGGKWVDWFEPSTKARAEQAWWGMPSVRKPARFVKIDNGVRSVIAKYEPPKVRI